MADQVVNKAPEKAKKQKKDGFFKKVSRFFRDFKSEVKKVVWPTKKQVINNTVVVFVVMGVVGAFIWILDWIFTLLRTLSMGLPLTQVFPWLG